MVQVMKAFGFGGLGYTIADFLEPDNVIQLGVSHIRIDILHSIEGVEFEACYAARETPELDGVTVSMISLYDLRKNKASTGRPKADLDLRQLGGITQE